MKQIFKQPWLFYALITTLFWGVWGAFIEIPEKAGFPPTLGYVIWALTMVPCATYVLHKMNWKVDKDLKSILLGSSVGLLGAGGQLILFQALKSGPAFIVFPIISLYPVLTIFLSLLLLHEKANRKQWVGILLALIAMFLLSNPQINPIQGGSTQWLYLSILVFVMWGLQAWVMKFANTHMQAESIFLYMTITALILAPVAVRMTNFNAFIEWGWKGPYLTFFIQILNAIGALTLVYALRYGKAIIVVPLTGLAPVITVMLSLLIYAVVPGRVLLAGLISASIAMLLLAE